MVIRPRKRRSERGVLEVDILIAVALLFIAAIPLMCSFGSDARALRFDYDRAVAMECVDGQMEVLAAGAWRQHPLGTNQITLSGNAARNLHPPTATLIRTTESIRLEWRPDGRRGIRIVREVKLP